MSINRITTFGINNLRRVAKTVFSGPTLESCPQLLQKIKDAGIKTIVDFRSEPTPIIEKQCEKLGLKFFKFGLNNVIFGQTPVKTREDFAKELLEFFKIMNKGNAYIGCRFGIDRTNAGLLFNYFLNPKSKNFCVPKLLPGTFERSCDIDSKIKKQMPKHLINTINKTIRRIMQTINRMTPQQRAELGLPENSKDRFEKIFKEKIGNLIRKNSQKNVEIGDY